jgi:hypothetical protein
MVSQIREAVFSREPDLSTSPMKRHKKARLPKQTGSSIEINSYLPVTTATAAMASAGESATCVASTAEAAAYVTTGVTTANMASGISATCVSTGCAAIGANSTAISSASAVSTAIAVAATITVAAIAPAATTPAVPRPGTDEEPAGEPARPVIAIGRAGVWGIRIIAPIANRGTIGIGRVDDRRTDANSNPNLSVCRRSESQRQRQEHCHQN